VIRLSIQARQAIARLTLPVLIMLSLGLILLGRASPVVPERARTALSDALAPLYGAINAPLQAIRQGAEDVRDVFTLRSQNEQLLAENDRLLKANLHWIPDPALSYVTARVVADAGGVYARSVLLSVGPHHAIRKGEIALDASGLVGRVTEVGDRSARVLLITDMNSRIPVMLETSREKAILVGANAPFPKLMYLPDGAKPPEGERVVTTAEANAFPAGLLVGTVHYGSSGQPELNPAANLDRLEIVRIFDYGLGGLTPPEAPGRTQAKS
jgi:rod shape-determining protein MreC